MCLHRKKSRLWRAGNLPVAAAKSTALHMEGYVKNRIRKAFTLIELIIVIVVLGILATIAILGYKTVIDKTNRSSVETSARNFDRALRTVAGFGSSDYTINGNEGDVTDTDPRKSVYLLDMLDKGDVPDQGKDSTALAAGSLRVLVYNGGSGASAKWTRLTCETASSAVCLHNPADAFDNTTSTHVGDNANGKLPGFYQTTLNTGEFSCVQFHKSGQNIYMGWPGAYGATGVEPTTSTTATVSPDITKACATADGVSAGTALTGADAVQAAADGSASYYDLAGAQVSDSSWGS